MAISKSVYVIHAGDATQHLNSLNDILQELIEEERIGKYSILESTSLSTGSLDTIGGKDMVIVLLTNGILAKRASIMELLGIFKERQRNVKIAEIIVDNIPYEQEFIAFPSDLLPIRSRTDMDAVWNGISENLSDLFPKPEVQPNPVPVTVPENKNRFRQLLEKPHLLIWLSIPVVYILSIVISRELIYHNSDDYLISDVYTITEIIIVLFLIFGLVSWLMLRFNKQVSKKLNLIHILATIGGFLLIRVSLLISGPSGSLIMGIEYLILAGQLIFPINVIYGLKRKRG